MENNVFREGDIVTDSILGDEIEIYVPHENVSGEYINKCVRHLKNLPEDTLSTICEAAKRYCLFFIELCMDAAGERFDPADFPPVDKDTPAGEMYKYFNISTVEFEVPENADIPALNLSGGCEWEPEHGIQICILGDKLVYLGGFEGNSPWGKYAPDDDWNFVNV